MTTNNTDVSRSASLSTGDDNSSTATVITRSQRRATRQQNPPGARGGARLEPGPRPSTSNQKTKQRTTKVLDELQGQLKDQEAREKSRQDTDKQDVVDLQKLIAKEKLSEFQDTSWLRRKQWDVDYDRKDLEASSVAMDNVAFHRFNTDHADRYIHVGLAQRLGDLDTREMSLEQSLESLKITSVNQTADRVIAEMRAHENQTRLLKPTNLCADEIWKDVNTTQSTLRFWSTPKQGLQEAFIQAFPSFGNVFKSVEIDETAVFQMKNAAAMYHLVDMGAFPLSREFDTEFLELHTSPLGPHVTGDLSHTPVSAGDLFDSLDSVFLCELPVECYKPNVVPLAHFTDRFVGEVEKRFGSYARTTATVTIPGLFSTSVAKLATAAITSASDTWSGIYDKTFRIHRLELRAYPLREATINGDNRPHIDRGVKAAVSKYVQYKPFVVVHYTNGDIRISDNPDEFGLDSWAGQLYIKSVLGFDGQFDVPPAYQRTFRPLVVDSSLLQELVQRKTAVTDVRMTLERTHKIVEGSEVHQILFKSFLYEGVSTYRDTVKFVNVKLTNSPLGGGDF